MSTSHPAPVKKGDVLGEKYRVEKVLGAGGMGVVVAARHLELDTFVALKLMLPEVVSDEELVLRFSREARAMVRLTSPHSARVFDVGKLPNGAPFMVMELLNGEDLGDLLDRAKQPLPVADVVDWILQACVGIAEAHALGIIHRDIKPRNIFLARQTDGTVVVKVLDFGLAKSVTTATAADHALTRTSAMMGSPGYMSPEQMRALRDVDAGTDIWSLGVCLYELLTNVMPFDAPTIPELCALVLTSTPRSPHLLRPDLPPELTATIMRCLERDRSRRFRDVGELAHALRDYATSGQHAAARTRGLLDAPPQPFALEPSSSPAAARGAVSSETRTEVAVGPRRDRLQPATIASAVALVLIVLGLAGLAIVRLVHRSGASAGGSAPAVTSGSLATGAGSLAPEPALDLPPALSLGTAEAAPASPPATYQTATGTAAPRPPSHAAPPSRPTAPPGAKTGAKPSPAPPPPAPAAPITTAF